MLRHRHETLQEELLRQAQARGGIAEPVTSARPPTQTRSNRAQVGTALLVVGWIWLLLGGALTLWFVWDYNHSELRTVTITRVAPSPTAGEDDCDFAAPSGEPAGQWSGDCPPGAVVGQEVELFITPIGLVFDSPDSMAAVIAVFGAFTALGALALVGLGWFLGHPSVAGVVRTFMWTLLIVAFIFLWAWLGTIWPWIIPDGLVV